MSFSRERSSRKILIFSSAGKPIYSLGVNDQSTLSLISSSLSAILSKVTCTLSEQKVIIFNVESDIYIFDYIKWMCSDSHRIVFLERQGIILCCVSEFSNDPIGYLKGMLEYVYYQLVMILTGSIHKILKSRPNVDIQQMIGTSDVNIIDRCVNSIQTNIDSLYWYYSFQKVPKFHKYLRQNNPSSNFPIETPNLFIEAQPMDAEVRSVIKKLIQNIKTDGLLGGAMFASSRIVTWFGSKYIRNIPSTDFSLLKNISYSLFSKKNTSNELWIPICLPCISTISYIYCYFHYWNSNEETTGSSNICFVLLSSNSSTQVFEKFSDHSNACLNYIKNSKYCSVLESFEMSFLDPNILIKGGQLSKEIVIQHFVYVSTCKNCYVVSETHPEIHDKKDIFQTYIKITEFTNSQFKRNKEPSMYTIINMKNNKFINITTRGFHLFVTFPLSVRIDEKVIELIVDNARKNDKLFFP
ncbi:putative SAND family [Cryptosporidium bovis]|uniref:putative SAND family n=1 Tax=Cryptosporidium bovis TaxID=310047 RepID=UPI00351A2450|nr:putative SAND family [Cryptosporidium bovis]